MSQSKPQNSVAVAEAYYDSDDAHAFYREIWGGEDIHIGLYDPPDLDIASASHATVVKLAQMIDGLGKDTRVLDIGAGYGGAARYLARTFGCHVTCLNLSDVQNAYNEKKNREQELGSLVRVVHGNFEALPFEDGAFDVVWSQDAILHSGNRAKVLCEVARVLAPGGQFVFTDPMQADDCPEGVLQPIFDRIHLASLGSPAFYRGEMKKLGMNEKAFVPLLSHLELHYARIGEELARRRVEIEGHGGSAAAYVERMLAGLKNWVDGAKAKHLMWGMFHFVKP
ncbi:MAG TPA: methyltransferase domain-containing protein [Hyphomicrobiaceae bacterium]|nr:methyltransferase domain-containing protein [Hyphomicrobiaceae bacterium]